MGVVGAKSTRAQSGFLRDSINAGLLPPALASGNFGSGDRALQTPRALLLYGKKL